MLKHRNDWIALEKLAAGLIKYRDDIRHISRHHLIEEMGATKELADAIVPIVFSLPWKKRKVKIVERFYVFIPDFSIGKNQSGAFLQIGKKGDDIGKDKCEFQVGEKIFYVRKDDLILVNNSNIERIMHKIELNRKVLVRRDKNRKLLPEPREYVDPIESLMDQLRKLKK